MSAQSFLILAFLGFLLHLLLRVQCEKAVILSQQPKGKGVLTSSSLQSRSVAVKNKWPFMVAIVYFNGEGCKPDRHPVHGCTDVTKFVCGAVIWNERTILTGLACMEFRYLRFCRKHGRENGIHAFFGYPALPQWRPSGWGGATFSHPHMALIKTPRKNGLDTCQLPRNTRNGLLVLPTEEASPFSRHPGRAGCLCGPAPLTHVDVTRCKILGWNGWRISRRQRSILPTSICEIDATAEACNGRTNCKYSSPFSPHATVSFYVNFTTDHLTGRARCNTEGAPLLCPLLSNATRWALVGLSVDATRPEGFLHLASLEAWITKESGET